MPASSLVPGKPSASLILCLTSLEVGERHGNLFASGGGGRRFSINSEKALQIVDGLFTRRKALSISRSTCLSNIICSLARSSGIRYRTGSVLRNATWSLADDSSASEKSEVRNSK